MNKVLYICNVKKIIATFLLFGFLSTYTSLMEILRLPIFIHHYLEHVEWNNLSLIEFLNEHYTTQIQHPDDEDHDHENLPFKSIYQSPHFLVTFLTFNDIVILNKNICLPSNKKTFFNQEKYLSTYFSSIWQPPRFS